MIKTCAICQKNNDFEDIIPSSKFTRPRKDEEKEYFNMWHRIVEVCPECGYASYDVSTTLNKNIINDEKVYVAPNGAFAHTIKLKEGENRIVLRSNYKTQVYKFYRNKKEQK